MAFNNILEKVRDFATIAHGEQRRKYSQDPYIVHPMRVMEMCRNYSGDLCVLAAAILHDVLEDTAVTEAELLAFLQSIMLDTDARRATGYVVELTDIFIKSNYPALKRAVRKEKEVERLAQTSAEAQTIKYADIIDNTDVTVNDPDFAVRYLKEARMFLAKMTKGHPVLREKATQIVEQCLSTLKTDSQPNRFL